MRGSPERYAQQPLFLIITKTVKRTEELIEHRVCCAVSSLQLLSQVFFGPPLTMSELTLEMRAEMHVGRYLSSHYFSQL
jgi:hypothetical protein